MKLYYTPGACSQAPHIVLNEIGRDFEIEKVDLKAKRTETGADYLAINPKGAVPALQLDDPASPVLTENAVILQYLADQAPEAGLIPAGGIERYRLLEWVNFITTELHKGFGPLFNPATPEAYKAIARDLLAKRFDFLARHLDGRTFIAGERFTIADAYAFVVLNWAPMHDIDLGRWPALNAYVARIGERPAVRATRAAEGFKTKVPEPA